MGDYVINNGDLFGRLQKHKNIYSQSKTNDKYELHVLLQNKNMDLIDFTVSAEQILFKHNQ